MHRERSRGPGPLLCKTLGVRFRMELELAATQLPLPPRQPQGTAATHSSRGSCRSRSWIPRAPRIASTRGWYSKMILRKPCRNGMASAACPDTHSPPPPDLRFRPRAGEQSSSQAAVPHRKLPNHSYFRACGPVRAHVQSHCPLPPGRTSPRPSLPGSAPP